MRRDMTLINDPNSIFAVARALRKQIVETDPNPQNRNNAIRDEKHIAYKSTGKDGYESFKYDILTSLEQLDNYFLELETVLGKITEDEDVLKLQQEVRKQKTPAKPKGRPKKTGAGFSGGVLPDLPAGYSLIPALESAIKSSSVSPTLKEVVKFYLSNLQALENEYLNKNMDRDEFLKHVEELEDAAYKSSSFDASSLGGDETDAIKNLQDAVNKYAGSLPDPDAAPEAEVSLKKRRSIPILTGNEFIVSTLSKINILLIKLIAEYNGKILINWKQFLQSDLEEIALKVLDSQKRFLELKAYLKDYEEGTKAVNITKFLSTIDQNFKKFIALTSRSIANFVNPNIQYLPNFSQQLSASFQDETQVDRNKKLDDRVNRLVEKYIPIREEYQNVKLAIVAAERQIQDTARNLDGLQKKFDDGTITKRERVAFVGLTKQLARLQKEYQKFERRMNSLGMKLEEIERLPEYAFFPRGV